MAEWKKTKITPFGGNKWKKLELWDFVTSRGDEVNFTMLIGYDVVVVFGITSDGQVLIIDEYYPSLEKKVSTLVAGVIENMSPEDTARAELREETGYQAEEFIKLGTKARGKYNTGTAHYYLATNIVQIMEPELEKAEDIENKLISMDELKDLIFTDQFQDEMEVVGVYFALNYLEQNKK